MPVTVSDTNSNKLLQNNRHFSGSCLLLQSEKPDALKYYESTGKPGEAPKNNNGNQSCIVLEIALFLSISKIISQTVGIGSPTMAFT